MNALKIVSINRILTIDSRIDYILMIDPIKNETTVNISISPRNH